jgi:tetratricopeptide (TPR) repeat protein
MAGWLRPLLRLFHSPGRAMAEARDRAPLGPALVLAFAAQWLLQFYVMRPYLAGAGPRAFTSVAFMTAMSLLFTLIVFVPVIVFVANLFERRASFGLALRQEFASVASCVLYARIASAVLAFPLALIMRTGGGEAESLRQAQEWIASMGGRPAEILQLVEQIPYSLMLPFFAVWLFIAIRQAFGFSWRRAAAVLAVCGFVNFIFLGVLWDFFANVVGWIFASPFLLILLFFLMRGYLGDVMRGQRARASFRQNLEVATLNPADASAHYNLGLLHLQRRELAQARARFERAVEIDPEETDAHYQLGRIARAEGRWADAVRYYGETLSRDQSHAQYEVWREAAATYVSAGQHQDALDALERFLEHRQTDPEGLYLMGRAHAGLGRRREAVEWLQRCIEAVRTSPAYKYRSEKRWASEAQQFLRSLA